MLWEVIHLCPLRTSCTGICFTWASRYCERQRLKLTSLKINRVHLLKSINAFVKLYHHLPIRSIWCWRVFGPDGDTEGVSKRLPFLVWGLWTSTAAKSGHLLFWDTRSYIKVYKVAETQRNTKLIRRHHLETKSIHPSWHVWPWLFKK